MIETLDGWFYSLQEPTFATTVCPSQANKQIESKGTGLGIEERTLPGAIIQKETTEIIYEPLLHLNISELSAPVHAVIPAVTLQPV